MGTMMVPVGNFQEFVIASHKTRKHRSQQPRDDEKKYERKAADGEAFLPQSPASEAMTIFVIRDQKRDQGRKGGEDRTDDQEESAKHYCSVRLYNKNIREDDLRSNGVYVEYWLHIHGMGIAVLLYDGHMV